MMLERHFRHDGGKRKPSRHEVKSDTGNLCAPVLHGAFCEFYEEQVRYALRLIADGKDSAFLWDGWDKGTKTVFDASTL